MVEDKDKQLSDSETSKDYTVSSKSAADDSFIHVRIPKFHIAKPKIDYNSTPWYQRLTVLLVVLVLGFGAGFLGGWVGAARHNDSSIFTGSGTNNKKIVTSESQLISSIAKTVGPSVVSVDVISQGTDNSNAGFYSFFGGGQSQPVEDAGTGIIISSDGLILTNRHVVPAGATSVSVTLSDGTQLDNVQVVGRTNNNDSLDVAFLKVTDAKGHKLIPAAIGDSSKVQVGDNVVAIGNALGQFQNTVTSGIISGYGRDVQAGSSSGLGSSSENLSGLFQTDAAINEGNSGGPLVNLNGQVIGINTAIASNSQNIGFAIPINDVTGLIKQVENTGKFQRPYLGVRYIPLTADVAQQYKLPVNSGAFIAPDSSPNATSSVLSGSPAEKAGLKENDIIVQADNVKIDQGHSLTSIIDQHSVGDTLTLKVLRDGKTITIKAVLGAAPSS